MFSADPRSLTVPFRTRDFRLLFFAQLASELGDWGARLALAVLVYDRTGSAGITGLVTVASFLPWAVAGPALSTLGDRFPRRTVMLISDLIRGTLFVALLFELPVVVLLVVVLLASLATPPYDSARSAAMIEALPDEDVYGAGVTVTGVTADAGIVVGYAAGGLLIALFGIQGAMVVNIASFFLSAELTRRLAIGRTVPESEGETHLVAAGGRAIRRDPFIWRAAWVGIGSSGAGIAIQSLLPVLAVDAFGATGSRVGLLAAASAIATGACGFVLPHSGDHRFLLQWQAIVCIVGGSVAAVAFALFQGWPALLVPVLASGVIFGSFIPGVPVIGARLPAATRSSSFGVLQGATFAVHTACAGLAGLAADRFGITSVVVVASLVAAAVGGAGLMVPVQAEDDRVAGDLPLPS